MPSRNWKHPPQTIQAALEACLDHARLKHHRSLDHVAADMGLVSHWVLYKWVESGRIPAVMTAGASAPRSCRSPSISTTSLNKPKRAFPR